METIELLAFNRQQLGRAPANTLRRQGYVPGVLYGRSTTPQHFYVHGFSLQPLLRTRQAYFINLNIEGTTYPCILQDMQYHPVSETLLHADFLQLSDRPIQMSIPVVPEGRPLGVAQGGKLQIRLRKIRIKALPENMPDAIYLNVDQLALGASLKVRDIKRNNFDIVDSYGLPVVSVQIPRALRSATDAQTDTEAEAEATTEANA